MDGAASVVLTDATEARLGDLQARLGDLQARLGGLLDHLCRDRVRNSSEE